MTSYFCYYRNVGGEMECRVFLFPATPVNHFKLFRHFAPTDADRNSTLYVDQTAILNYPCPDLQKMYYGNEVDTNPVIPNVESWQACGMEVQT